MTTELAALDPEQDKQLGLLLEKHLQHIRNFVGVGSLPEAKKPVGERVIGDCDMREMVFTAMDVSKNAMVQHVMDRYGMDEKAANDAVLSLVRKTKEAEDRRLGVPDVAARLHDFFADPRQGIKGNTLE